MRDKLAALLDDGVHHGAGDDGPGERGAEQVDALVDAVGLDRGVDEVLDKLLLAVGEDKLECADLEGLLAGSLKVFLLPDVGHERDHLVSLLDEPCEDAGSIQSARVGEQDAALGAGGGCRRGCRGHCA